jgi:hypothetical protein
MREPVGGSATTTPLTPAEVKANAAVVAANAAVTTALNASAPAPAPTFMSAAAADRASTIADKAAGITPPVVEPALPPVTRVAANQAKKDAGPPYAAPAGSHWTWIGTDYQLYQDSVTSNTGSGTISTPATPAETTTAATTTTATGPTLSRDVFKQTLAIYFGQAEASKPWVDELYNLSSPLYKSGATMDEALNMALIQGRNDPKLADFTNRFKGLFALQDAKVAGKAVNVPTIAEYYNAEAGMGAVLKQAGLGEIATSDYLSGVIGKGLSVTDVGNYINNIYTEIQNLPTDIKAQVTQHYPGLDNVSLAKSILTGDKGFSQLQQDLNTYEIQGVSAQQGLGTLDTTTGKYSGLSDVQARDLVGQGYNMGTATTGLSQVALAAPTYQKLQEISTGKAVAGTQAQQDLIDANMKKLASQQRAVEQAAAAEAARFQGASGTSRGSFSTGYLNKQASSGAF